MSDDAAYRSKLRWRCRRGMQEMDILLLRYLEKGWPGASPSEREDFERLLETEDDVLWDWLISREQPSDPRLACLVEGILRLPPH